MDGNFAANICARTILARSRRQLPADLRATTLTADLQAEFDSNSACKLSAEKFAADLIAAAWTAELQAASGVNSAGNFQW